MTENEISRIVVDICYHIHKELGPGLLESVYEEILCYELKKRGLAFTRQQPVPVFWDNRKMEVGFRADIIIEDKVIIEIKSVESLKPVFFKILLTYLKLTDKRLGILVNFSEALIKTGIKRVANNL